MLLQVYLYNPKQYNMNNMMMMMTFLFRKNKFKSNYNSVRNIKTVAKIPSPSPNPQPNLNQSTLQVPSVNETKSMESFNQKVNNLVFNPENRLKLPNSHKRSHSEISSNKGVIDPGHVTKKPLDINSINDKTKNWIIEVKNDIPKDSSVPEEYKQEPVRAPISFNETPEQFNEAVKLLEVKLNETKNEIYRLSDEIQTICDQVEEYVEANLEMIIRVAQCTPWNNRSLYSENGSPIGSVILDNRSVRSDNNSVSSVISDNGNVRSENGSNNGNVALEKSKEVFSNASSRVSGSDHGNVASDNSNGILSNASSDQIQGYKPEPLNSGLPLNDVEYTDMFRFDNIIHKNYNIYMQGNDTVDYRMAYEYLIDSLNTLDNMILEHQTLLTLENNILQRNVNIAIESENITSNIDSILEVLNSFN